MGRTAAETATCRFSLEVGLPHGRRVPWSRNSINLSKGGNLPRDLDAACLIGRGTCRLKVRPCRPASGPLEVDGTVAWVRTGAARRGCPTARACSFDRGSTQKYGEIIDEMVRRLSFGLTVLVHRGRRPTGVALNRGATCRAIITCENHRGGQTSSVGRGGARAGAGVYLGAWSDSRSMWPEMGLRCIPRPPRRRAKAQAHPDAP